MIHVVVGVLRNTSGEVLVTQRPVHKSYSGYWEFPGGKREPGEGAYHALVRELKEELNIDVQAAEPWKEMEYAYPDKVVYLDVWMVTAFKGVAQGMEKQAIQWVHFDDLETVDFLPANKLLLDEVRQIMQRM